MDERTFELPDGARVTTRHLNGKLYAATVYEVAGRQVELNANQLKALNGILSFHTIMAVNREDYIEV